ncbi:MAG: hypothetical protein AVDCRST_MAG91-3431, partial [uncultured Sphingomonadaceae bacterium]
EEQTERRGRVHHLRGPDPDRRAAGGGRAAGEGAPQAVPGLVHRSHGRAPLAGHRRGDGDGRAHRGPAAPGRLRVGHAPGERRRGHHHRPRRAEGGRLRGLRRALGRAREL